MDFLPGFRVSLPVFRFESFPVDDGASGDAGLYSASRSNWTRSEALTGCRGWLGPPVASAFSLTM
jgi:hypothetical protein